MWDKLGAIIMLVIGCCLILFREKTSSLYIRKHFEGQRTPKRIKYKNQLKEMKFEGVLFKGLEITAVILGIFIVILGIFKFSQQADKYIRYFTVYFMLILFAACVAALIELKYIAPFLMKDVHKYTQDNHVILNNRIQNNPKSGGPDVTKGTSEEDSVLRALQKKSFIYLIVSFMVLFTTFAFIFYAIFMVTS